MTTAPPPARQRFNPRGRAAALPSSYTTTRDTTRLGSERTAHPPIHSYSPPTRWQGADET